MSVSRSLIQKKVSMLNVPIEDDVKNIWKKTWEAEILLLFVPTYGGLPLALWVAFTQRQQGILEKPAAEELKDHIVSAVVLASPQWSSIAERTPSIVADQLKNMGREVEFLADRTLEAVREIFSE